MPTDKTTLGVLAGCPTGASEHALAMIGIGRDQLDRLAADGLAVGYVRTFANPRGLRVAWFYITDAGRARINRQRK
jgi:hypothetical protein